MERFQNTKRCSGFRIKIRGREPRYAQELGGPFLGRLTPAVVKTNRMYAKIVQHGKVIVGGRYGITAAFVGVIAELNSQAECLESGRHEEDTIPVLQETDTVSYVK